MWIQSCSILTMSLNIDLLHVFNCTTCRLTVFTCHCNNTLDDAEAVAAGAPTASRFWCVRQKLFHLSDYKAGDSAAGDSSPSLRVVGRWRVVAASGVDPRVAIHHIPLRTLRL